MLNTLLATIASVTILFSGQPVVNENKVIAQVDYSLENRYSDSYVNEVFADNILLTLAYMGGKVKSGTDLSWEKVKSPGTNTFYLRPGETFAFHESVLPKYKDKVTATTNAHFNSYEGFKSDGWLVGDGVCHLASFIYALSLKAGLTAEAPTNHDFAVIPEVPREQGVSIYYTPNNPGTSTVQNLYVTNNFEKTIAFVFTHDDDTLNIKVEQVN